MDFTKALLREERKLAEKSENIETRLRKIRAAINALNSEHHRRGFVNGERLASPLRGRKLSAAHRKAIREGIAKAKAA